MSQIIQFASIISSFLVLCGVIKFYIYYKQFGISIIRFISIDEILILFMDNLLAYLCILVPTTFCIFIFDYELTWGTFNEFLQNFKLILNHWPILILMLLIMFLGSLFYKIQNKGVTKKDLLLINILFFICCAIIPPLFKSLNDLTISNKHLKNFSGSSYSFIMSIILLTYSILSAYNESKKVLKNNYYSKTRIFFSDSSFIESDTDIYFIGMTKNFLFVYDRIKKICTSHKMDTISRIEFPKIQ